MQVLKIELTKIECHQGDRVARKTDKTRHGTVIEMNDSPTAYQVRVLWDAVEAGHKSIKQHPARCNWINVSRLIFVSRAN
jgi:hypothetical protein